MTNNDVFNTFMHLTGLFKDMEKLQYIFELGGLRFKPSKNQVGRWRKDVNDKNSSAMPDPIFDCFIQGLFEYRDQQYKKGIVVFNFDIDFSENK